jgi:G protein-coupled glucose receptor regulating Gpa2
VFLTGGLFYFQRQESVTANVLFTLASLAFINPNGDYSASFYVCWLPIRPLWYRLALSWIPRYIIFIITIALFVAPYSRVGGQFNDTHTTLTPLTIQAAEKDTEAENRPRKVSFNEQLPENPGQGAEQSAGQREPLPEVSKSSSHRHTMHLGSLSKHQTLSSVVSVRVQSIMKIMGINGRTIYLYGTVDGNGENCQVYRAA